MNNIIAAALERKRTVISLLVFLVAWGAISYREVSKESVPDIKIPIIFVKLYNEGMSPADAERLLVKPVELEVRSIEGVKEMRSSAYESGGNVVLEFAAGFDTNKALLDVREAVDKAKSELPDDADEPEVEEVNLSLFPVLVIKLSGQVPFRTLSLLADDLSDRIESKVSSVLKAEVVGEREEAIEILADPKIIDSYAIAFDQVIANFTGNNQLVSAGKLNIGKGEFAIKVPGLVENVDDIMNLPIITNGDAVVKFKDIAQVRRTFKDADNYARDRGVQAVAIEVSKRTGTNLIDTVEEVKKIVAEESSVWNGAVKIDYAQDDSDRIRIRLNDLENNLISAIFLVMLVIISSLGMRSALLVGIAVPGSFLTGVAIITTMGYTMNIVVLFALIFAIGMLVDAAIIVVEFADRRISEGYSPTESFLQASQRMAWPVITSIGTILVVFLPLLFWPGTVGQFMKYMPITLIAVLSASICMALFFVPAIGSIFLKKRKKVSEAIIATSDKGDLTKAYGVIKLYIFLLRGVLRLPKTVLMLLLAVLVGLQWAYIKYGRGVEFFPDIEPDVANIYVHARDNMSLDEKDAVMRKVEQRILNMKELQSIYTRTGDPPKGGQQLNDDIIGSISIEFADWRERRSAEEILADINRRMDDLAGVVVEVEKLKPGPPERKPIDIIVQSRNSELLGPAVTKIRQFMDQLPGLKGIEDNRPVPGIDWNLAIDRAQAAKFGANVALVGNAIRLVTNGVKIGTYRPDDAPDELDVLVRYDLKHRNLQQLDRVRINTTNGSIPISNFVKRTAKPKLSTINRLDGYRVYSVKADVQPDVLVKDKVVEIKEFIKQAEFSPSVDIIFKGEEEDRDEAQTFLMRAFGTSIFLIALILLTQFNSFFSAGVVLSAIVMSTMGVYIGLLVNGLAFGVVMGGIGVIALAGIIVSNNIILIETYDLLAKKLQNPSVMQMQQVILKTCAQRARPVVLTQLTTVLGLLPIMNGVTVDFLNWEVTVGAPSTQWWVLLSTCIVYGATFASIMTLIATPCMLMARVKYRAWRRKSLV